MKHEHCQQWTALSDRQALGEPLTPEEAEFERTHRSRCTGCAAEAAVWQSLANCLEPSEHLPEEQQHTLRHRGADDESRATTKPRWWNHKATAWSAAVAAAALVTVGLFASTTEPVNDDRTATSPASDARVSLTMVSGDVTVGGAQASAGAVLRPGDVLSVREGRACLTYSWGTSACTNVHTELLVLSDGPAERRLLLKQGTLLCRLDEATSHVRVETTQGTVTGRNSLFAVEHTSPKRTRIRLHRGTARVTGSDEASRTLHAPAAVVLKHEAKRVPVEDTDWQRDLELIDAADLWAQEAVTPLDVTTRPPGAQVSLNGTELGRSPISMLVGRGRHRLVVRQEGYAAYREELEVIGAQRVSRAPQLEAVASEREAPPGQANDTPASDDRPASSQTAAEMLERARDLRRENRFDEAAQWYAKLLRQYPQSAEASVALLSLGDLQLSQLGQPKAAFRSFDRYLQSGGPLKQEASYGRIRALRALGNEAKAKQDARAFVQRFPDSPQAESLRRTVLH